MDEVIRLQFVKSARRALDELERHPQSFKSAVMAIRMDAPVEWEAGRSDTVYLGAGADRDTSNLWEGLGKKLFLHG